MQSLTPECSHSGLGSSHFARRYFGNRVFFLFLWVLRCFSSPGSPHAPMDSVHAGGGLPRRVSPFRHPRINGYLLLPEAFRSLSRLSSALSAKASTLRSSSLDLMAGVASPAMASLVLDVFFLSLAYDVRGSLRRHIFSFTICGFQGTLAQQKAGNAGNACIPKRLFGFCCIACLHAAERTVRFLRCQCRHLAVCSAIRKQNFFCLSDRWAIQLVLETSRFPALCSVCPLRGRASTRNSNFIFHSFSLSVRVCPLC